MQEAIVRGEPVDADQLIRVSSTQEIAWDHRRQDRQEETCSRSYARRIPGRQTGSEGSRDAGV
jgi:hypothetical protein